MTCFHSLEAQYEPKEQCGHLISIVDDDPGSSEIMAGVTDLEECGAGVKLWSLINLSVLLLFARSALAPGLIGDASYVSTTTIKLV